MYNYIPIAGSEESDHTRFYMLLTLIVILLTSNALNSKREISIYYSRIAILGLISVSYINYNNLHLACLEHGISIYGSLLNVTNYTVIFNLFISIITCIILILTGFYPRKLYVDYLSGIYNVIFKKINYNKDVISNKLSSQFRIIEYALIILFAITGGIFLMSSADLISVFLCIELQSYALYIISSIYRNSELSTGSALVYFLLGGLSSCFILLGSGLIYAITGTTNLDNIYLIINMPNIFIESNLANFDIEVLSNFAILGKIYYIQLAIIVMVVGFLFKVSAAPFHFWSPDVYDGIPTIVTTFVAIIAKISIFVYLLDFVYQTQSNLFNFSWTNILLLSSLISLIIGSILGLTQFRIKRLLAYSTISHVGFILLALSINTPESIQSYIFYILQYSISNLNAFIILLTIGYTLFLYVYKDKSNKDQLLDKDNSPIQLVSQIKGYFYINSYIAISLAITLFSFVGIPPIVGFFAKQKILSAALDNGYIFMSLIAILTSVIGAGYYLNLIKNIFFFKNDYKLNTAIYNVDTNNIVENKHNEEFITSYITKHDYNKSAMESELRKIKMGYKSITINSWLSAIISIITLWMLLFIYIPDEVFNLVNLLTVNLFKA